MLKSGSWIIARALWLFGTWAWFRNRSKQTPFGRACHAKNATTIFESPLMKNLRLPFRMSKINTERYQNLALSSLLLENHTSRPALARLSSPVAGASSMLPRYWNNDFENPNVFFTSIYYISPTPTNIQRKRQVLFLPWMRTPWEPASIFGNPRGLGTPDIIVSNIETFNIPSVT
jgi:hypothetical protein